MHLSIYLGIHLSKYSARAWWCRIPAALVHAALAQASSPRLCFFGRTEPSSSEEVHRLLAQHRTYTGRCTSILAYKRAEEG